MNEIKIENTLPADVDIIITDICERLNIEKSQVFIKSNKIEIIEPRFLCIYFIRKKLKRYKLKAVAKMFGYSNHTCILHAVKKVEEFCLTDKSFKNKFNICDSITFERSIYDNVPQY